MGYNDDTIEKLRECFEKDGSDKYTNCALVFAYNGTGKTRLSYDFAHYGREEGSPQHTLYYNAYTEDLFTWDNDLENNTEPRLMINQHSSLIQGLAGYNFSDKLRNYLQLFTDIDFDFHYDENSSEIPDYVTFYKVKKITQTLNGEEVVVEEERIDNIKISRGEERLFVWCFFRCIVDQVLGGNEAYKDIEYIYIDDPMSSLDDNNVITFGQQLYSIIRQQKRAEDAAYAASKEFRRIKFVVSSHHALFFHVMVSGLNADSKMGRFFLSRDKESDELTLKKIDDTVPFYYNVAMMAELQRAIGEDKLYTYHFNVLRSVMEKIKEFFGHYDFRYILDGITYNGYKFEEGGDLSKEELADLYSRIVNVFSHQSSMFSPTEMNEDNKRLAKNLFYHLKKKYQFQLPQLDNELSEKEINFAKKANKNKKYSK